MEIEIPVKLLTTKLTFSDDLAGYVWLVYAPTEDMVNFMMESAQDTYAFVSQSKSYYDRDLPVLLKASETDICLFRMRFGF